MIERPDNLPIGESENIFYETLVEDYLRCESVTGVVRRKGGVSEPGLHHILDRYGIVKTANGIHHRFPDILSFFSSLVLERTPLEGFYKNMPLSFRRKVSTSALHKILEYTIKKKPRRYGTALVVTPEGFPRLLLVANDMTPSNPSVGKHTGDLSFAMGFRNPNEANRTSVLRIVQRELWKDWAVKKIIPKEVISEKPEPFMKVDVVDVRVDVYHMVLPAEQADLRNFSSFKLANYRYVHLDNIVDQSGQGVFRTGIGEIASGYKNLINGAEQKRLPIAVSSLNQELISLMKSD